MFSKAFFTFLLSAGWLSVCTAQGSHGWTADEKYALFELVKLQNQPSLHLSFDFETFLQDRESTQRNPGLFALTNSDEESLFLSCDILLRGQYRRKNCDFPPFKLDFDEDDLKKRSLKRYDEYKFVTQCMSVRGAKQTLAREYVAYCLYESLTEYSYRTLLLPIVYRDIDSDDQVKGHVMMLESDKGVSQRLDCAWYDGLPSDERTLNAYHYELFALFQYMIGNRDVSITADQNVKLIDHSDELIPIPYDFDFSLFVDAPYAFTSDHDRLERIYLGNRENQHVMDQVFELFRSKEAEFYEIIDAIKVLKKQQRKQCKAQIRAFYAELQRSNYQMVYLP